MNKYINQSERENMTNNLREFIEYRKIKMSKKKMEDFIDMNLDLEEAIDFYFILISNIFCSNEKYINKKHTFIKYLKDYGCDEKIIDSLTEYYNPTYDFIYLDDILNSIEKLFDGFMVIDSINYMDLSECIEVPKHFSSIKDTIDEFMVEDVPLEDRADEFYQLVGGDGHIFCISNYEMKSSYLYKIWMVMKRNLDPYSGIQGECYVEDGNTYIIFPDYYLEEGTIDVFFLIISILLIDIFRN